MVSNAICPVNAALSVYYVKKSALHNRSMNGVYRTSPAYTHRVPAALAGSALEPRVRVFKTQSWEFHT